MSILSKFTPNIEIYSIDEAFLKFEGFDNYDLESYCQNIKDHSIEMDGNTYQYWNCANKSTSKSLNRIAKKISKRNKRSLFDKLRRKKD